MRTPFRLIAVAVLAACLPLSAAASTSASGIDDQRR